MKGSGLLIFGILILLFVIVLIMGFVHVDWNAITGFFGEIVNKTINMTG